MYYSLIFITAWTFNRTYDRIKLIRTQSHIAFWPHISPATAVPSFELVTAWEFKNHLPRILTTGSVFTVCRVQNFPGLTALQKFFSALCKLSFCYTFLLVETQNQ